MTHLSMEGDGVTQSVLRNIPVGSVSLTLDLDPRTDEVVLVFEGKGLRCTFPMKRTLALDFVEKLESVATLPAVNGRKSGTKAT